MEIRININGANQKNTQEVEKVLSGAIQSLLDLEKEATPESTPTIDTTDLKPITHKHERIQFTIPVGVKEEIDAEARKVGMCRNEYIRAMMKAFFPSQTVLSRLA